jgi:hypothetical protein
VASEAGSSNHSPTLIVPNGSTPTRCHYGQRPLLNRLADLDRRFGTHRHANLRQAKGALGGNEEFAMVRARFSVFLMELVLRRELLIAGLTARSIGVIGDHNGRASRLGSESTVSEGWRSASSPLR